jgi:hypothetical protein
LGGTHAAIQPVTETGLFQAMMKEMGGGNGGAIDRVTRTEIDVPFKTWTSGASIAGGGSERVNATHPAPVWQHGCDL